MSPRAVAADRARSASCDELMMAAQADPEPQRLRVASVVGARPQFIKAAPLCRVLRQRHDEILIHTGQHFDPTMSDVFFEELAIPKPDYSLGVGGGGHGQMTGEMLARLEALFLALAPDWVLVYGDTNTTLAGGLAAAKLQIPLAHVEAGLRSFNRAMPEEVNRVVVDHLSSLLLCPTETAVANLAAEGVRTGVELVGDVMLDTARTVAERVSGPEVLADHRLERGRYYLATVHRPATSDDSERLQEVIRAFGDLDWPVIWPAHPRTRRNLSVFGLNSVIAALPGIRLVDPLPYLETNALLRSAKALLTDSGGMQKEAYFFGVPCVTLREETEWVETVELGWNKLVGTSATMIVEAAFLARPARERPALYGDGHAAEKCVAALERVAGEARRPRPPKG